MSSSLATALTTGHQSIEGLGLSPDGRWLAFDSDRGGHQAIYRVPVTGGEPQQISSDSDDDFMPSWSPDGRHLVFHSDRSGRFELYVVERDTAGHWGSSRQLTTAGGQDARWSPDGGSILYLRNSRLWVIASAGGAPRLLVDVGDSAGKPAPLLAQWSPDGHTIYYKALDSRGNASLWAIPAAGASPASWCASTIRSGPRPAPSSPPMAGGSTSLLPSGRATCGEWSSRADSRRGNGRGAARR